jgi:hypothetical protein
MSASPWEAACLRQVRHRSLLHNAKVGEPRRPRVNVPLMTSLQLLSTSTHRERASPATAHFEMLASRCLAVCVRVLRTWPLLVPVRKQAIVDGRGVLENLFAVDPDRRPPAAARWRRSGQNDSREQVAKLARMCSSSRWVSDASEIGPKDGLCSRRA